MMRKSQRISLFLWVLLMSVLLLSSCNSGISQADYNETVSQRDAALLETDKIKDQYSHAVTELEAVRDELAQLKVEYEQLQETAAPYIKLSAAEAEAQSAKAELEKAQAEKELAAQKAAEQAEQQRAQEQAQAEREAEEKKGYNTGITYSNLARTPDDFKGKKVKFSGTVIQVIEGSTTTEIRFAVNDDYDRVIYCYYTSSIVKSRILEDDYITIYGTSDGLLSYESTSGAKITVPAVNVDKIEQ